MLSIGNQADHATMPRGHPWWFHTSLKNVPGSQGEARLLYIAKLGQGLFHPRTGKSN